MWIRGIDHASRSISPPRPPSMVHYSAQAVRPSPASVDSCYSIKSRARRIGRVSRARCRLCLGSRWWAAMKSSWTPSRDKRLLSLQAAGRTAAEIAKSMGISRNAVIGRSRRLRDRLPIRHRELGARQCAAVARSQEANEGAAESPARGAAGADPRGPPRRAHRQGHGARTSRRRPVATNRAPVRNFPAGGVRKSQGLDATAPPLSAAVTGLRTRCCGGR